jgi:hypothetical protein
MAWSVSIDGEVFRDTDFTPFTYPTNFPRIFEAISNQASTLREDVIGTFGVSMLDYYDSADGTDYAPSLRRALASGEKTIYIPEGNYRFESTDPLGVGYAVHFRDKTGITLRGASDKTTTLTIASSANVGILNFASCTDCVISDLKLDGNRVNQSTTSNVHGIRGAELTRCRISRVTIQDTVGYGLGLQVGTFLYNTFEDLTVTSSGNDGVDVKNNTSNNIGNQFTRLLISDWRRGNPADPKAAFDTRGGVRISDSTFYLTNVTGYASNMPFLRFRPDEQANFTFVSAVGSIINNSFVTGASSGATGIVTGSTNASTATVTLRGVDGVFTTNEILNFDNGSTARFSSASYTVQTGGRDPSAVNCRAYGPIGNTSTGIGFVTSQSGSMFINCVARNLRDGFNVQTSTTAALVDGSYAQFCNSGYYIDGDDTRIIGCTAEGAVAEAVYLLGQRGTVVGFRGRECANGIRKQGTSLDATIIDCQFQTTTSTDFPGSWTQGTFTAFNTPGLTNAFEFNGHSIVGGSGHRVGFYGGNGSTKSTPRGVSHTRALQTLFSAISETGLVGNGIVNGVVTGSPETVVSGNVGDIANRTDQGGHLYYKQYGSSSTTGTTTGWVPLRVPAPGTIIAPNYIDPRINFSRTQASSATSVVLGPDGVTYREYGANDPRFRSRMARFTFEGAKTNLLDNPRGEGIVAGGTPTGWSLRGTSGGISRTYSSSVMVGLPSVVITPSGASTTSAMAVRYTISSNAVVSPNTTYTASGIFRLVSGSTAGLSAFALAVDWLDSGGTAVGTTTNFVSLTSASATATRYSGVLVSPASAAFAAVNVRYATASSGVVVNAAIEIAAPQLEAGPFATTPVLPAVGNLMPSTRSADSFFASTEVFEIASTGACTIAGSFVIPVTSVSSADAQTFFEINDGSANNRYFIRNDASTSTATLYRVTAGAASSVSLGTITPGVLFRLVMTIDGAGRAAASLNGGTVQAVTGGPTANMNIFRIGNNSSGSAPFYGQIQSLRLLNYAVTDAEIPAIGANVG